MFRYPSGITLRIPPMEGLRHTDKGGATPPAWPFTEITENPNSVWILFVLLHEIPVRVYLKFRVFTVGFDEHLVVPLTIRIVFSHYVNDLPAPRLFLNCLLDGCGERLHI